MAIENFKVKKGLEVGTGITANSDGVDVTGIVTATQFKGDGSGLTGVTGSGSGVIVKDEGSAVGTAGTINFVGSGVAASMNAGTATVTINAGSMDDVVDDTTPQLGGNLDLNSKDITGSGDIDYTGNLNVAGVSTFGNTLTVTGSEGTDAIIQLLADDGDDNEDKWRIRSDATGNGLKFESYYSGSWSDGSPLKLAGNGIVTIPSQVIINKVNINQNIIQLNSGTEDLKIRGNGTGGTYHLTLDDDVTVAGVSTFNDDVTFTTANSKNIVFDKDANDLTFGDSVIARFGDSNDLSLYHDSSSSNIVDTYGALNIKSNILTQRALDNSKFIEAQNASFVKLYYAGNEKLATTVSGITVPHINVSGIGTFGTRVDVNGLVFGTNATTFAAKFPDGAVSNFGTGNDLQISHANDVSLIRDARAGAGATLAIGADKLFLRNKDGNENYLEATDNGSVKLFYDFAPKFETDQAGVIITGVATATSFSGSGAGLTNIPSAQLTGALPALDGSALTGVTASGTGIIIKHDGSTVGTAGTINFSTNLDVSAISAGIVTVTASGSGGVSLSGSTNNTVATVTGANALIGEANLTFDGSTLGIAAGSSDNKIQIDGTNPYIQFREGTTNKAYIQWSASGNYLQFGNEEAGEVLRIGDGESGLIWRVGSNNRTVWTSGNDGTSSGLDADLLDGQEGSYYTNATNLGSGTIPNGRFPATLPATSGANLTNLPVPTQITVADESSDTSCNVLFSTAATGDLAPKSGTNLTFNSANGTLTATTFSGALSGNATSADTVDITNDGSANTTFYPTFVANAGSAKTLSLDTGLTYVPSSNILTAGTFSGSGASLTNLNGSNIASGTIPIARVGDNTVTFAKLENIPTTRLVGRTASGTGDASALTAAEVRTLINVEDGATAGITTAQSNIQVTYTVTANGSSAYRFAGHGVDSTEDDPNIYLIRGQKYRFVNNSGGSHPFQIRSAIGGSAYSTGVTNNGGASGNIDFAVPYDAPANLFYQCTSHGGMVGNLYIHGAGGHNMNVGVTTFTGRVTISSAAPNLLFTETDANPDWGILCSAGQMKFQDMTSTANILTLDDDKIQAVKNLDAMAGIDVTGNANVSGDLDVVGNLSIADKIIHTGDTNCFISFPAADQIVFEGGGHERFRINGTTGKYLFGRDITGRASNYNNTSVVPTIQIEDDTEASFSVARFSDNTDSSRIYLQKGRGSTGSAAAVQDNDTLGMIVFNGYNGSGFRNAAQILAEVDGTPTSSGDDTDMPGALVFKTSEDGTNVPAERLRIGSNGSMYLGYNASDGLPVQDGSIPGNLRLFSIHGTGTSLGIKLTNSTTGTTTGDGVDIRLHGQTAMINQNEAYDLQLQSKGELAFRTGSTPAERLRITSAGRVGINSTTPEFEMDVVAPSGVTNTTLCVKGTGSGYSQLRLEGEGGATENYITSTTVPLAFYVGSGGQKAKLDTNGMLLIGAGGADSHLHIKQSTTSTYAKIESTGSSSNYTGINLKTPTLNFQIWNQGPGASGYSGSNSVVFWQAAATGPFAFYHGNTERLRIASTGHREIRNYHYGPWAFTNNTAKTTITVGDPGDNKFTTIKLILTLIDGSYRQGMWQGEYTIFASNAVGGPGVNYYLKEHWQQVGSSNWSGGTVGVSITSSGALQVTADNGHDDAAGNAYIHILDVIGDIDGSTVASISS